MIEGVKIVPLPIYAVDERGEVMEMLKATDPHFIRFGHIYFSTVRQGAVKGWHKYFSKTLNYACISGLVKLVLFDDRKYSPTNGTLMELFIGPINYKLVQIPHGVWNGFKGIGEGTSIVANCSTTPFNEADIERMLPHDSIIPYKWDRVDK